MTPSEIVKQWDEAATDGLAAGKAVAPDPAPPADFHVGAQSWEVVS